MISGDEILNIFPKLMRERFNEVAKRADKVQEIRLLVNRPIRIIINGKEFFLSKDGNLRKTAEESWFISEKEIDEILNYVCKYSLYAFEDEISQGFITIPGGHRIGLAGQVVQNESGKVRNLKHIRFLNIRISHEIIGAADRVFSYVYDKKLYNSLIIAPPGCGKTTILRDLIRLVSNGRPGAPGLQVGIVDERSEIAGSFMGIPQNDIGIRTFVMDACPKVQGMILLIRSMAPQAIAVDEIGSPEDIKAIARIHLSGCKILATIHGDSLDDADQLKEMFERFIILGKKDGVCQVKEIYNKEEKIWCA